MTLSRSLVLGASLVLLATAPLRAQVSSGTPVIEAGGQSVSRAEFEALLNGDPRQKVAMGEPGAAKAALGAEFGRALALELEARRRGVDQDPAVQLKIRNQVQQLLVNELLVSLRKGYMRNDEVLKAHYAAHQDEYAQPRVRHILVRMSGSPVALRKGRPDLSAAQARAKAESLLARLSKGADFAALARTESDDLGSAPRGGDIGFVAKGSTVAAFEAAAYALPTGETSGIVATEYGFHILHVDAREPMSLDSMRAVIANELAHRELEAVIDHGFTLNTAYFGRP